MPFLGARGQASRGYFGGGTTPDAPTSLVATRGDTEISVAFSTPAFNGGLDITNYEYSLNAGSTWTAFSPADITSPVLITGLSNGTTFTVYLRAVNALGFGTTSNPANPVTPAGVPGSLDTPVATLPGTYGNTTALVTWSAPSSNGSAITDYVVRYSSDGGSTFTTFNDGVSTATSATVTGLTNGYAYTFHVWAVNAVGISPYLSNSIPVTPLNSKIPTPIFVMDDDTQGRVGINFSNYIESPVDQAYVGNPSGGYFYNYFNCGGGICPNDTGGSSHGWTGLPAETSRSAYLKVQRFGYADSDTVFCSETSPPAPVTTTAAPVTTTAAPVTTTEAPATTTTAAPATTACSATCTPACGAATLSSATTCGGSVCCGCASGCPGCWTGQRRWAKDNYTYSQQSCVDACGTTRYRTCTSFSVDSTVVSNCC